MQACRACGVGKPAEAFPPLLLLAPPPLVPLPRPLEEPLHRRLLSRLLDRDGDSQRRTGVRRKADHGSPASRAQRCKQSCSLGCAQSLSP
eukprot:352179-Chlamydomonas_euryale.AAC.3